MIRVLVVDDSALMRRVLSRILTQGGMEVTVARDATEALGLLHDLKPDVVTLDVNMPGLSGLDCLDRIMVERPCPVVMVSSLTAQGADVTLSALQLGAVDFLAKPEGAVSLAIDELTPVLLEKVRGAALARVSQARRLAERVRSRTGAVRSRTGSVRTLAEAVPTHAEAVPTHAEAVPTQAKAVRTHSGGVRGHTVDARGRDGDATPLALPEGARFAARAGPGAGTVVLVGTSTGGPPALDAVLTKLPEDFPWPIVVAQHMPAAFTGPLARRLDRACALEVAEVTSPQALAPGRVYVGRGDADIIVGVRQGVASVMAAPASAEHRWHPSVDRLVASAMAHLPPVALVGVLMTGMGNDGAAAMAALRREGGRTIAEAEESAVVWGMPGELVKAGGADEILRLDRIAGKLLDWAR